MIIWALKYWKYIAVVTAILSLVGALFAYGNTQYQKGKQRAEDACMVKIQNAQERALQNDLDIEKSQRNVIRPDTRGYINGLRRGDL